MRREFSELAVARRDFVEKSRRIIGHNSSPLPLYMMQAALQPRRVMPLGATADGR